MIKGLIYLSHISLNISIYHFQMIFKTIEYGPLANNNSSSSYLVFLLYKYHNCDHHLSDFVSSVYVHRDKICGLSSSSVCCLCLHVL